MFLFIGGFNLYAAFNFSADTWSTFKLFDGAGILLVFITLQAMILGKYLKQVPRRILTADEQNHLIEKIDNMTGKKQ